MSEEKELQERVADLEKELQKNKEFLFSCQNSLIHAFKSISALSQVVLKNKLVTKEELDELIRDAEVSVGPYKFK